MQKKQLGIILTLLLILSIILLLSSCSKDDRHSHELGEWIEEVTPTCITSGTSGHYHCSTCGKNFDANKNEIEDLSIPKSHTFGDWVAEIPSTCTLTGTLGHYHCSTCGKNFDNNNLEIQNLTLSKAEHNYINGICSTCGLGINSNKLSVSGEYITGSVSNVTEIFSFLNDISVNESAEYIVATDISCSNIINSKTVELNVGDNRFYILVTNGKNQKLYTVTIRRLPVYNVLFTIQGTTVESQQVEEGNLATAPSTLSRPGYTFIGWNYDFSNPIMENTEITGNWKAKTDTPYKVEYYIRKLGKQDYELHSTEFFTGTTDTKAFAEIKEFEGYDFIAYKSISQGNINGNGTLVLKLYYSNASFGVNGTVMMGYTIATDLERTYYRDVATSVQNAFHERTGIWFKIVDSSKATENSIVIKHIDKVNGEDSFKVYTSGSQLIIECAFDNMLEKATSEFLYEKITNGSGDVNFTGNVFKKDISVVYYEDFGAVGDGRTGTADDDFKAIYETHKFANECGQTVKANRDNKTNCTYYIFDTKMGGNKPYVAQIKTNTDWCGASFIIDDTKMHNFKDQTYYDMAHKNIFEIVPDAALTGYTITDPAQLASILGNGINPDTEYINLDCINWDGPIMIVPYNSGHKVFRRKGYSAHSGEAMHELIVVEADGRVNKETPIMFDYTSLSKVIVYKLDPATAITVENGKFITKESRVNHIKNDGTWQGGYIARGISVSRSYTTVKNIEHVVEIGFTLDERAAGMEGPSNTGFFRAQDANEVTFKDCIIPARIAYNNSSSYNLGGNLVNKIVFDGCVQSNFWVTIDPTTHEIKDAVTYDKNAIGYLTKSSDKAIVGMGFNNVGLKTKYSKANIRLCWGVGGTNYCKNMQYLNSSLSRIDAHAGLYNGAVINCNVNDLELTGYGEFIMQDTNWYPYNTSTPLLFLRSDYGYHWDGDILVKNVNAYVNDGGTLYIANHIYSNWYFGYTAAFPNITIDNLDLYSMSTGEPLRKNYPVYISKFTAADKYKHLLENDANDTTANKNGQLEAVFDVIDSNGDGYVDEPLMDRNMDGKIDDKDLSDLDGNGIKGETSLKYADYVGKAAENSGVSIPGCTVNLNITKPPQYIKVINNDGVDESGGYKFIIKDTSGEGVSDGGWYNTDETYGGFFGDTKFIYGEGENDFFYGTANDDPSGTFNFIDIYY